MAATWKEVLTSQSTINADQLNGFTEDSDNNTVVIVDNSNNIDFIQPAEGKVVTRNNGGAVVAAGLGDTLANQSDVTGGNLNSDGNIALTINALAVTEGKIAADAVGADKIKHKTTTVVDENGNAVELGVLTFSANGTPTYLTPDAGGNKYLKTTADGDDWEWSDSQSATNVAVDADNPSGTARRAVIFGGDADVTDDTGATLFKDYGTSGTHFSYDPSATAAVSNHYTKFDGTTGISPDTDNGGGTARLIVDGHIKADLQGTAGASSKVYITNHNDEANAPNTAYPISYVNDNADRYAHFAGQDEFSYNPNTQVLKVPNLVVTGDQVVTNVTEMMVEDKTVRLGASTNTVTPSGAAGAGIIVNIGISSSTGAEDGETYTNADANLPRLVWDDQARSNSALGWRIAKEGAFTASGDDDANALDASTAYGVGVMHHSADNYSDEATVATNLDIGVGAFYYSTAADKLYIQTGV